MLEKGSLSLALVLIEGPVGLLSMVTGKRSAGYPVRMGVLSGRVQGRGRNWGNWAYSDGRGATQMPTCSMLHARREGQKLQVPTSSTRQSLQDISSAGFYHPKFQQRTASFLEGHGPQAGSGAESQGAEERSNRAQDENFCLPTSTAITKKSTKRNATDPLVLTL